MMGKNKIKLLLIILLSLWGFLSALEKFYSVDFKQNHYTSNVIVSKDSLQLQTLFIDKREARHHHYTFDQWLSSDSLSSESAYQDLSGYHQKSLKFLYPANAVTLNNLQLEFLNPQKNTTSFKIIFYFYTFAHLQKFSLINTKDLIIENSKTYYQGWEIMLKESKVVCEFLNNFHFKEQVKKKITLESQKSIQSDQWYKVEIAFNALTGKLQLFLNEEINDLLYVTSDNKPYSSVYYFDLDETYNGKIILGEKFLGKIDELSISTFPSTIERNSYREGIYTSQPIFLKDSQLQEITFTKNLSEEDIVLFYLRCSPKYFPPETTFIPWIKITSFNDFLSSKSQNLIENKNSFYQFKIILKERIPKTKILLPASMDTYQTKSLKDLKIVYKNLIRPIAIREFTCKQQDDDNIVLSWIQYNNPSQIDGYTIYYAKKSFQIENSKKITFAKEDVIRFFSPKNEQVILQYTLPPLEKNEIYYFAITAFNGEEYILESPIINVNSLIIE